jgi:hypothetical protein
MKTRLGFGVFALALITVTAYADQDVKHTFTSGVPSGTIRRVIINIPAGEVSIRNGAPDRIALTGEIHRTYDGWRQRDKAQRIADDVSVEIQVNGDEAVVERRYGPNAQSWSAKSFHSGFEVKLELPPGVDVEINTRYGEVQVDGVFGNVTADLRAGEIRVRSPRANVRAVNASVRVGEVHADTGAESMSGEGLFPGVLHYVNAAGKSDINVHTTFGEVHVTLTR